MPQVFITNSKFSPQTDYCCSSLEAGSGKSYTVYNQIAVSCNKTVIVVPRIDLIKEHLSIFGDNAIPVYSEGAYAPSVATKIAEGIATIEEGNNDKHVLIVTHKGFLEYTRWDEIKPSWNLVIDEYMEYYTSIDLPVAVSSKELLWDIFEEADAQTQDEDYTVVKFSSTASKMLKDKTDFIHESTSLRTLHGLSKNSWIAIRTEDFGKELDTLTVLSLLNASLLENFVKVSFLADGFNKSQLHYYLTNGYGIEFKELDIKPYKPRTKSLAERITIYQIAEQHNVAGNLLRGLSSGVRESISKAINKIANTDSTIWTVNKEFEDSFDVNGTYLTPKQSGSNAYKNKTTAVWMAAMKTDPKIVTATESFISLKGTQLDEVRELEPMHQFITRTNIREYDSEKPINVIVFGPQQANYLAARYGISTKDIVKLNVDLGNVGKSRQRDLFATDADRKKFYRCVEKLDNGTAMRHKDAEWFITTAKEVDRYEERFEAVTVKFNAKQRAAMEKPIKETSLAAARTMHQVAELQGLVKEEIAERSKPQ